MRHPAADRQLADLTGVERGLDGEVEAVQIAHGWEVGGLAGHLDPTFFLAGHLALTQEANRLA